jgi:phosphoglycolate phosphatase
LAIIVSKFKFVTYERRKMNKKTIIFDLDGTLIDSLQNISICANKVLKELHYPTHKMEDFKYFIGDGAKELMRRCLPQDLNNQQIEEALELFKQYYSHNIHSDTKVFDGIYDILEEFTQKGYSLNILSNKPHEFTIQYYEKLFAKYNFDEVYGQKDNTPKKPDPTTALNIAKKLKKAPKEIFFVGDTSTDMQTAKNSAMIAIGVLWGIRDENELRKNGADHIIKQPKELLDIIM